MPQLDILRNKLSLSTNLSESSALTDWISQAEAARLRGVSRQAIAKLVSNGRLVTLDVGGRVFVCRTEVLSFEPHPAGRRKKADNG
jgi:hypothetical protein